MITEIVPDTYDITVRSEEGGGRFRVFLFEDDGPTLIDTGYADTTERLIDALDDLGIEPERLIVTHGDADHVGGFDTLVDTYDLETFAPANEAFESEHEPDVRYADGDEIGSFTAVHVPGHTPHHHALIQTDRRIAVMGDALFGSDVRGLPPGYFVLPPEVYTVDIDRADRALSNLLEYEFDTALLFHGSSVTEDAREKLERFVTLAGRV